MNPQDYPTLSPYLTVVDAAMALALCKEAFDAEERFRLVDKNKGTIGHAELLVHGCLVMLAEEDPAWNRFPQTLGGTPFKLSLMVDDPDAAIGKAAQAGATVLMPAQDQFYVFLLPNSRIDSVLRSPLDYPGGSSGSVLTVEFNLNGNPYRALNGGPGVDFTDAVSFQIHTSDRAETDRLWSAILSKGGEEVQCGWIKDAWGLSWQIVPERLTELLKDPDSSRARRAMEAMMKMVKIDISALEDAASEM